MAEQIKFTDEEISQINKLRDDVSVVFLELGQLHLEKKRKIDEFNSIESNLLETHSKLVEFETNLFKSLNEKYGDGNYDPETGVFTPVTTETNVSQ
jgi:hypothetical protein